MRRSLPLVVIAAALALSCAACDSSRLDERVVMRTSTVPHIVATTTTVAPPPKAERPPERPSRAVTARAAVRVVTPSQGNVNGYPCGGDLPPCWVLMRESRGNPKAVNPTGCGGRGCHGLWQFDPRTWAGYGGVPRADMASPDVQNAKARLLWANGRGCSHWAACGRR